MNIGQPLSEEDIQKMAQQIMGHYTTLQTQVRDLQEDYDKDEATLLQELQQLNEQNVTSLRNYTEVTQKAQEAKKALGTIVDAMNNKE